MYNLMHMCTTSYFNASIQKGVPEPTNVCFVDGGVQSGKKERVERAKRESERVKRTMLANSNRGNTNATQDPKILVKVIRSMNNFKQFCPIALPRDSAEVTHNIVHFFFCLPVPSITAIVK